MSSIGVGLRHQHFPYLMDRPQIKSEWFEVISENFLYTRGYPFEVLMKMREDFPISMHGVSLNIASCDELDMDYLKSLKELIDIVKPFNVSDHLCWTGGAKNNLHNLLPFPYNKENLAFVADRISQVQDYLGRQILIENLSAYFNVQGNEFSEWEFVKLVAQRSGCKILLDINNIYVNSVNQGFDPYTYLNHIEEEFIGEFHLAGFSDMGDYLFDTHSNPVFPEVWKLYEHKIKSAKNIPTLIEWDEDIPEFNILEEEVIKAQNIVERVHGK